MTSTIPIPKGTAPIKQEYLIDLTSTTDALLPEGPLAGTTRLHSEIADATPEDAGLEGAPDEEGEADTTTNEPPTKRIKLSGAQRRHAAKERNARERAEKKKGMNKGRRFLRVHDALEICWKVACGLRCDLDGCKNSHDIPSYLTTKPPDIFLPTSILCFPPFIVEAPAHDPASSPPPQTPFFPSCPGASRTSRCPYYDEMGWCKVGFKCRFLGAHLEQDEDAPSTRATAPAGEGTNDAGVGPAPALTLGLKKHADAVQLANANAEMNGVNSDLLRRLRKREYPFIRAKHFTGILKANEGESMAFSRGPTKSSSAIVGASSSEGMQKNGMTSSEPEVTGPATVSVPLDVDVPLASMDDDAERNDAADPPPASSKILERPEKRRLYWKDLTYLAPLTTVGNLPFRRLCVTLGADITVGEMGLSHSFLQGSKEEWSLVRRHPSEKMFGVQIAGNNPTQAATCAEVIGNECPGIDFMDLNAGCPIDLVYQAGSGSALLNVAGKFGKCLMGMNYTLRDVPVTVKMRTGVKDGAPTAHKLMSRLHDWGISSVALHGRTRQQRYTRAADWGYIKTCVSALRAHEATMADSHTTMDADVTMRESGSTGVVNGFDPIPFWGNGDCFSGVEYWDTVNATGVDGILVARGALIKPWIFTEIKERRDWDISSRERLDLIRKYAEFGLCHFGTDTAGVNTTRRYLCEALSFMHRYVPIGLLEVLPPKLNDRAPAFRGRDELETLLASVDSRTWVKISEMFLGPAPAEWTFVPKHKSNAYGGDEEAQG